jgi:hypothetical protein
LGSGALITVFNGSYAMAATTVASIYIVGAIGSFLMPETTGELEQG